MTSCRLPSKLMPIHREDLIRVGQMHDGGYVVTRNVIEKSDFLIGLGISTDWSFEEDFLRINGQNIPVHGYDHTISERFLRQLFHTYLKRAVIFPTPKRWKRTLHARALLDGFSHFFDQTHRIHFAEQIGWARSQHTSIESAFKRVNQAKNVFIKIDIEGSEYRILDELIDFSDRISGMAIEFHELDILEESFLQFIDHIEDRFYITHIHANNYSSLTPRGGPNALEISLENKEIACGKAQPSMHQYPIAMLDQPNNKNTDDYQLIFS